MINNDRIVPVMKMDFLSLIGTVMALNSISYSVLEATDIEGDFSVTGSGAAGTFLANQPVKSLNFASGVTGATVYFVADFGYQGMSINSVAEEPASGSDDIVADGISLYKAVLSSGDITITAVTPAVD